MQLHYTTEEVRGLVAEGACLNYPAPTTRDVAEATDVLEGVEELIAKLPAGDRFAALSEIALQTGHALWIPVAHNCRLSAGVSIEECGTLSFAVRGEGDAPVPYFAARQAAAHALLNRAAIPGGDLPAPEENGFAFTTGSIGTVADFPDGEGSENMLGGDTESGGQDGEDLPSIGSERSEGAVDFALKGLAGDEPSDLAVEGLAHPEGGSIRYLGRQGGGACDVAVAASDADPADENTLRRRTPHPEWRERLEELRAGGELPADLLNDAATLLDEADDGGGCVHPEGFLAELSRRRGAAALTDEDLDTEKRARRLGALGADSVEAASLGRLASSGRAHLRAVGRTCEILLVPEDSPAELVAEAAERSRRAGIEERKNARRRRLPAILDTLLEPARALSLDAVLCSLGGSAHKGFLRRMVSDGRLEARKVEGEVILAGCGTDKAVFRSAARLAKRARRESFANRKAAASRARERGSKAFAAPVVPFGGKKMRPGELAGALEIERAKVAARDSGRAEARVRQPGSWDCEVAVGREGAIHVLPIRRREVRVFPGSSESGVCHAWPVSITTVLHDPAGSFEAQLAEERAAGFGPRPRTSPERADRLPEAERESGPDPQGSVAGRSCLEAERRGEAVIGTYGRGVPGPSRSPRQRANARRRVAGTVARKNARRKAEDDAKARRDALACRAAWREALKIHLAALPATDRLELFLKIEGRRELAALELRAADPDALREAARELAGAGRIKIRRGRSSGKVFLEAGALDHRARARLEKELLNVMALAKPGRIKIPKGTRLARRVAAARWVMTRAKPGASAA